MPASSLKSDLRKRDGFDSPEQEAMLSVLRLSDRFSNRLGRLFREYGLTSSQYNVLRILRGEGKPLPSLEVADRMIQVVPAITGLIDRLEKQGLVSRERSAEDRRVVYVEITKRGLAVLAKIDDPLYELHRKLLGKMPRKELAELIRLLCRARESFEAAEV
ncbi:MarR family winged helix-turn-helix transcriptional regulator [Botrimarina mediterranea]|uniref:HTH-type transcriptional regulator MhqR n=1 Tax=Botrimarina mediterranea TaxID=2528022 RepID=A0A518K6Q8_9BACT|nr:MarR family transcriptional regulator [Botrimarina mediterranea]QDV73479.1 HTH-type transcriptional regulator MhqR [Botrimarina mediterranea]